ncbi:MAG: SocA family protein [Candidatus Marinimicrobia bacterium]|nr:SocA family protein [Candidatus Neomarinimicrobiota bacterium]
MKIVYFADKDHLSKYGRSISTDRYVAMQHGPVPSGTYDLIKNARNNFLDHIEPTQDQAFRIEGNCIHPLRGPNTNMLSESEREVLDKAIKQYGSKKFIELKALSHDDPAYLAADENDFIPVEAFVKSVPGGNELWDHLTSD